MLCLLCADLVLPEYFEENGRSFVKVHGLNLAGLTTDETTKIFFVRDTTVQLF